MIQQIRLIPVGDTLLASCACWEFVDVAGIAALNARLRHEVEEIRSYFFGHLVIVERGGIEFGDEDIESKEHFGFL